MRSPLSLSVATLSALLTLPACGTSSGEAASGGSEAPPDGERDVFVIQDIGKADAKGIEEHSFDGICVLRLVNVASLQELAAAGVFSWPAQAIYDHRAGEDGVLGTSDDRSFDDLEQLDDVDWVGFFTFRSLKNYAKEQGFCPKLGQEFEMPGETANIQAVADRSEAFVRTTYADDRPARRDAHAKSHGCVTAEFTVDNSRLDPAHRIGIYATNATYPAWIRFSNGAFHLQPDDERDVRGMAIKLLDVDGAKILEAERDARTQDFLLINGPTMFVRNPADYVRFTELALDGNPVTYFISLDPRKWHLRELFSLLVAVQKTPGSPLTSRYWSTTPYAHGQGAAIKYSARPCDGEATDRPEDAGADYLSEAMAEQLRQAGGCFEFMLQHQTDPENMPIEDPTYEWSETASPFIPVGRITIPKQDFTTAERVETCENLSFTPWHSLPEHRPLGGINRVRKLVYETISAVRHALNEVPVAEPVALPPAAD